MHKYLLTGIGVSSRYKVEKAIKTKKASEVASELEAIYNKCGVFKHSQVFQWDNGSGFESDIRRTPAKYKHTYTAVLENFNKEFKILTEVSAIWVKNLGSLINKMNNTKSLMIAMKLKDVIKIDSVRLIKTNPEEKALPKHGLYRYLYRLGKLKSIEQ